MDLPPQHALNAPAALLPPQPADFIGVWRVRRLLIDHFGSAHLNFTGQARIEADAVTETGLLHGRRGTMEARRFYRLAMDAAGIDILFADGSPFVRLGLSASQRVHHQCGSDLYQGRFLFRSRDCFAESWRVSGPRKRYTSLTRYARI